MDVPARWAYSACALGDKVARYRRSESMGPNYYRSVISGQYHLVNRSSETQTWGMPAKDSPTVTARRERLRDWIEAKFGSQTAFVSKTRFNQGMLSALLKPDGKSFGEKVAASLEKISGMPAGYLVKSLDPLPDPSQDGGLDLVTLQAALVAVKKAIRAADVEVDLYSTAPLIAFAYREAAELPADATKAQLEEFDKHISGRLMSGVNHGEWQDEGRTAGDGTAGAKAGKAKKASNRDR